MSQLCSVTVVNRPPRAVTVVHAERGPRGFSAYFPKSPSFTYSVDSQVSEVNFQTGETGNFVFESGLLKQAVFTKNEITKTINYTYENGVLISAIEESN